ncbi:MAG: hypothetical protein ACREWG_03000 [Gammaproteobacteria bacterium]
MFKLATEPQSIGKVLDSGVRLYTTGLSRVVLWAFLSQLVVAVPGAILQLTMLNIAPAPDPEAAMSQLGIFLAVLYLVGLSCSVLFFLVACYRLWQIASGDASVPPFKRALVCLLPTIGAFLLYMLAVVLGMVLLLVPAIIFGLSLGFSFYIIVVERIGPIAALKRSHYLVWGDWWRTLAILTVALLILVALSLLVYVPMAVLGGIGGIDFSFPVFIAIQTLLVVLVGTFTVPLIIAIMLVQYHDLRLRKEGTDLAARIAALDPSG